MNGSFTHAIHIGKIHICSKFQAYVKATIKCKTKQKISACHYSSKLEYKDNIWTVRLYIAFTD